MEGRFIQVNKERSAKAAVKRKKFIEIMRLDPSRPLTEIAAEAGMSNGAYTAARARFPDFAAEIVTLKAKAGRRLSDAEREIMIVPFKGNFVERRLHYFGYHTPWFQQETEKAYSAAGPGDIVLVLMPPEHGKTSFTEDYLTDKIAMDKSSRITCISEGQQMARKISGRIQRRLQHDGPAPDLVRDFGPFQPQTGEGGARQPWGIDAWSVYGADAFDERDYTMAIGGWRSTIAGTRTDHLHFDDIQSKRSINATDDMWELFTQDMLSRPGEHGKTTGNGTRVGERDFYERMDDEFRGESFYRKIEFPALVIDHLTGELKPLWEFNPDEPELRGYTLEQLERLRKKVGEDAWWRNYMQQPRSETFVIFSEAGIDKSKNTLRQINHNRNEIPGIENDEAWISIDPSIGGINVVCAAHPGKDKLMLLEMREDVGLPRNSALAEVIDDVARRIEGRGWRPTKLVIEAMAFQKGLMEDEFILETAKSHGMQVESHLTGNNKYDENIGIPSMASSFEAGSIDVPYNTEFERAVADGFFAQLRAWKPIRDKATGRLKFQRGTRLRQDQLMAFWFLWIWWTELRTNISDHQASSAFNRGGLPYTPTGSGLLVPA